MRIALLGNGKTGSRVVRLCSEKSWDVTIFNQTNQPTVAALKSHDIAISFLPGPAFESYIDTILESNILLVCGSTGFSWPNGLELFTKELEQHNHRWVYSGNFSTGNSVVMSLLEVLSRSRLVDQFDCSMVEIHHQYKVDSPSGTALLWQDTIGKEVKIESIREGDEKGTHQLTLTSPSETITITHRVSDRDVFAEGALLAAELLFLNKRRLKPGMYNLQQLMQINYLS
jgi:4-hydroxy-tetrahydrodipicolinate reductase